MSFYESMVNINNDNANLKDATLKVHVGTTPAKPGELLRNAVCGTAFNGEIEPTTFEIFECHPKTLLGRYVQIQLHTKGPLKGLAINQVVVFTASSWDNGKLTFYMNISMFRIFLYFLS